MRRNVGVRRDGEGLAEAEQTLEHCAATSCPGSSTIPAAGSSRT